MPPASAARPLEGRTLTVLGTGAVGSALARALTACGANTVLWSRSPERAAAARALAGPPARAEERLEAALEGGEAVLVCASEVGLAPLVERVGAAAGSLAPRVALHTNGLLGAEALAPLAELGWPCGKLHPLVALPPGGDRAAQPVNPFHGVGFAVGGDPEAFFLGDELARALGGRAFELGDGAAERYHAAAALLAGGLVALFDMARAVADGAVLPEEEAEPVLLALLASVERNLRTHGAAAALTGPAARGAEDLVRLHLEALAEHEPRVARTYALLAERSLELASGRGSIDEPTRERLAALLGDAHASGA